MASENHDNSSLNQTASENHENSSSRRELHPWECMGPQVYPVLDASGWTFHQVPECEICESQTYNLACNDCRIRLCDECVRRGSRCVCFYVDTDDTSFATRSDSESLRPDHQQHSPATHDRAVRPEPMALTAEAVTRHVSSFNPLRLRLYNRSTPRAPTIETMEYDTFHRYHALRRRAASIGVRLSFGSSTNSSHVTHGTSEPESEAESEVVDV